jgi:hypothetical protein
MTSSRTIDVPLTATVVGNTIRITGQGDADLTKDSGAHRFNFTITQPPGGPTVSFGSLDREDDCSTCPPKAGNNSQQIVGVQTFNNESPKRAFFTDNNNNSQPMDVSYQWNFTCDDKGMRVEPFDPIIRNGGET